MRKTTVWLYLVIATMAASESAIGETKSKNVLPRPSIADYKEMENGIVAAREGRCEDALAILPTAVNGPTFNGFPQIVQALALEHLIECAVDVLQRDAAITYLNRILEYESHRTAYWSWYLVAMGAETRNPELTMRAFKRYVNIVGTDINYQPAGKLRHVFDILNQPDLGKDRLYEFLETLYKMKYSPKPAFETSDRFMIEYARMSADRGEVDKLKSIVLGLSDPGYLLQVRLDKRFDEIRDSEVEAHLDLEAAAIREIARLENEVRKYPQYAAGYVALSRMLTGAWRFDDALEVIEPIALKMKTSGGASEFVDSSYMKTVVLQAYARALDMAYYFEHSEAISDDAVEAPAYEGFSVTHKLNYASDLWFRGNSSEALKIADDIKDDLVTANDKLHLHNLILCAKATSQPQGNFTENLAYLIQHQAHNPRLLIDAYLCMNDLDKAAEVLIAQLASYDQRIVALMSLQAAPVKPDSARLEFSGSLPFDTSTPLPGMVVYARFDLLRDRNDVQQAVDRVGRFEAIWLKRSAWR